MHAAASEDARHRAANAEADAVLVEEDFVTPEDKYTAGRCVREALLTTTQCASIGPTRVVRYYRRRRLERRVPGRSKGLATWTRRDMREAL